MSQPLEVRVPFENVNDPTAKLLSWAIASGATVKVGDLLAQMENSKATFDVTAPGAGTVEYSLPVGEEVTAGDLLCLIHSGPIPVSAPAPPIPAATPAVAATAAPSAPAADAPAPVFSAKAAKLVKELGLDPALFAGMAMVQEADVKKKAASGGPAKAAPSPASAAAAKPAPMVNPARPAPAEQTPTPRPAEEGTETPLERAKLFENRELAAANSAALRSTIYHLCPAPGFRDACVAQTPAVNRLAVILFEAISALAKFPHLNACLVDNSAFLYRHVNVGFAVDIDRGLKVLVIRKANQLTFPELTAKIEDLLVKYSTNTLAPEDVTGSTFTVTDLSQEGVFAFEPLLNNRQSAILGIGAEQPGLPGFMLICAFDHRLTSGRVTSEFLHELSARLVAHSESLQKDILEKSQPFCSRCFATLEDLRQRQAFLVPTVEPRVNICSICLAGH